MDRNREVRRMAATNGLTRRRQRTSSLRDSPEEEEAVELQETARLRDRGSKKEKDRLSRTKRRRGDRLMHGSNREEGGEESTEESLEDDDEDDDEDAGAMRMLPPNQASSSSTLSNQHHHRKGSIPGKVIRAAPSFKVADEMIGISVPRKARSASVKRSHEYWISGAGGGGGEPIHRQASTSPARPTVAAPSPPPVSPSSSNASIRKKVKPIGPKHRPPKISKSSTVQEEIEIEVAEVLFGLMRQSQCSSKQEIVSNALQKQDTNGSSNDAKSRVSSPISNSPASATQPSVFPLNPSSSTTTLPAVAPKRKRPRPVKVEDDSAANFAVRNTSNASATTIESEQTEKAEVSSPKLKKNSGSAVENGGISLHKGNYQTQVLQLEPHTESAKPENNIIYDSKVSTEEEFGGRDGNQIKEETPFAKKESPPSAKVDVSTEDLNTTPTVSTTSKIEVQKEEKFKIDLMAPPMKSSPDRDGSIDLASDPQPIAPDVDMKMETMSKDGEKVEEIGKQNAKEVGLVEKKKEEMVEESSQKQNANKERVPDLQLDLEKQDMNGNASGVGPSKHYQEILKLQQQFKATTQPTSLPLPLPIPVTVPGWSGGPRSVGYPIGQVSPLQGVVLDESAGSSSAVQPPHFPLSQPRPKRCATHCYIARNIYYHQQFTRMNPFWAAGAGSASVYGAKPYNLNVPPTETTIVGNPLTGGFPGRSLNVVQDNGQIVAPLSGHTGKDKSPAAPNLMDSAQRKQLVLQQAPQPAAAGNLLHGPAFVFPLGQQQTATAAATRSGAVKSGATTGNAPSSSAAGSAPVVPGKNSSTASGAATVSFNYPNLPPNDAQQYLAILQNSGYPFPIPSHVGAPPPYRGGTHAQAKHQQQRLQGSGSGGGGAGNSQGFPASKNRLQLQQQQQQTHNVQPSRQSRQLESHLGAEDGPTAADSRVSHSQKAMYGQNFPLPMHLQNFSFIPGAALAGGASGNPGEKLQQQQSQQQSSKGGMEVSPPQQSFTMSFPSFNGAGPSSGIDFSSMPQIFQSLPEAAARNGFQISAVTAQAAQQKNHHISEEGKSASDSMNAADDERKAVTAKGPTSGGQSLVFSRPDTAADQQVSSILGNNVMDSLIQSSSSPVQSPQWKNSARTASSTSSPSLVSTTTTTSSLKNLPQQQSRVQQGHTQISFGMNAKSATASQGQQHSTNNQSPSSPVVVGSPPSSLSKSTGGSPRTTPAGSKVGAAAPSISSQQSSKNAPSGGPSRKSSPTASVTTTSTYHQRGQAEQQQQQLNSSSSTSSSGMLAMCSSLALAKASNSDPTKTGSGSGAAAGNNMRHPAAQFAAAHSAAGNSHPFMPTTFPYVHGMPAMQVKPATEQKQPSGE
ncbi:hypothetical protein BVC80_441g251 [Macleaya cordata]|uniref:Protein TIME FOR COFFEE n=1 Tax=Macleaya cordata TaxID=56857 RepID=A0A200Q4R8_MACCD|nr:hypothetical protein BVC80_441g251 [Macleaya cordata]